jgi:tRNA dimethylallyltransferase
MKKQKLIVICGPTASGKSDFAVELALKKFAVNGVESEIISADSRQVYRGLDIGSGKITVTEMNGVPHHLLDVADLSETFSVAQYKDLAVQAIKEIIARGKTPILCGGTGMYIDAVICDTIFPAVEPNVSLRAELERESVEALAEKLRVLDSARYALIDTKNKVRLIRAIEIASALGKVPPLQQTQQYDVQWHYLDFPDDVLKKRIHDRLHKRFEEGMLEEVVGLSACGVPWEKLEALGLEYRYIARYLRQMISREVMMSELEMAIWHYAKRQRTWFKKYAK